MRRFLLKNESGVYILHDTRKDLSKYIGQDIRISFGKEFYSVIQAI